MTSRAQKILQLALEHSSHEEVWSFTDNGSNTSSYINPILQDNVSQTSNDNNYDIQNLPIIFEDDTEVNDIAVNFVFPTPSDNEESDCTVKELNNSKPENENSVLNQTNSESNDNEGYQIEQSESNKNENHSETFNTEHDIAVNLVFPTPRDKEESDCTIKDLNNSKPEIENSVLSQTNSESNENEGYQIEQSESNMNENHSETFTNTEPEWGDVSAGRKRKITADKSQWKRVKNQELRMKGQDYLGFSRDKNKNFKHNTPREREKLVNLVHQICV